MRRVHKPSLAAEGRTLCGLVLTRKRETPLPVSSTLERVTCRVCLQHAGAERVSAAELHAACENALLELERQGLVNRVSS